MLLNWTTGLKHLVSPLGLFVCKGDRCMFMLICVYRCVYTFVLCGDSWGQSHMLFLSLPSSFLLRKGLSLAWNKFSWIAWMSIHQAPESSCSHLPSTEVASMLCHARAFCFSFFSPPFSWMWILGIKLKSSVLQVLHLKDVPSCWHPLG